MNKETTTPTVIDYTTYAGFINGLFILPDDPQQRHQTININLTFDLGQSGQLHFENLRIKPSTTVADILRQHHLLRTSQVAPAASSEDQQVRRIDVANIDYRGNTYIVSLMSNDEIIVQKTDGSQLNASPTYNAIVKRYRDKVSEE